MTTKDIFYKTKNFNVLLLLKKMNESHTIFQCAFTKHDD